jgi:predicted nicotinamide N-methyase
VDAFEVPLGHRVLSCIQSFAIPDDDLLRCSFETVENSNGTVQVPTLYGVMECIPISISLPPYGDITILEASADAQNQLVDFALSDDNADNILLQDPYGAVLWPAASAVASYFLTHCNSKARSVLELGCGTGLVSLALASFAAPGITILATDYEPLPLQLLQYAAQHYNQLPNRQLQTMLFDICNATATLPVVFPSGTGDAPLVVVAADLLYDAHTAVALAQRVVEALREHNATVIVGDSPGRPGRPDFVQELHRLLGVPLTIPWSTVMGQKVTGPRHNLICGPQSTSVALLHSSEPIPIDILHLEGSDYLIPPM